MRAKSVSQAQPNTHGAREREGERTYARTHTCLTLKNFERISRDDNRLTPAGLPQPTTGL